MNNPQRNPKRSPVRPDYLVIIIIILAAIGLYFFFTGMQPDKKVLNQSDFITEVNANNIKTFSAEYVGGDNLYVYRVTGTYHTNPTNYDGFEFTVLYDDLLDIIDTVDTYNVANPATPIVYAIN